MPVALFDQLGQFKRNRKRHVAQIRALGSLGAQAFKLDAPALKRGPAHVFFQ